MVGVSMIMWYKARLRVSMLLRCSSSASVYSAIIRSHDLAAKVYGFEKSSYRTIGIRSRNVICHYLKVGQSWKQ